MAIQVLSDTLPNDSDKSFTMGLGSDFRLISGTVRFTATTTVGLRQMTLKIKDSNNNLIYKVPAASTQAESTAYVYSLGSGILASDVIGGSLTVPFPGNLTLGPGWIIQISDNSAIDPTGDDMDIFLSIEKV